MLKQFTTCLWFDRQAEEAAKYYTSIFKRSKIKQVARYGKAGREIHGGKPGEVLTVEFELAGNKFIGLNGGPLFSFNPAVSIVVKCETQREIDYYWERLSKGGPKGSQQCGWLKDKYGVSWQIVPTILGDLMAGTGSARADRVMTALLKMGKLDIAKLKKAAGKVGRQSSIAP
jgi:predicted 3-demethylubiquinone-9 3-methyltransferase (glyoxalase superfamily)